VRNTRPVVTKAIDEVANTREAIPPMLAQAEKIVNDMHDIGQNTSEGAVTGVFTGILKTPFKIVGGIGKTIFGTSTKEIQELTQMDEQLMIEAIDGLVATNKIGKTRNWANPESGNEGAITLKEKEMIDAQECLVLHFVIRIQGKERANTEVTLCLNDESEWEVYEE
jgi:surface antigen